MVLHEHCNRCYNARCQVDPLGQPEGECCMVVNCPSGCQMSLHACKVAEHESQTCANYVVPCLNGLYGCSETFPRGQTRAHLRHCPANVITCNLEWNRWRRTPIGNDDWPTIPSNVDLSHTSEVLDVAYAARDQRLMEQSLKMPRRLRQSLQSRYTTSFPAVPLMQRPSLQDCDSVGESGDSLDFFDSDEDESRCPKHPPKPGYAVSSQSVHCSLCTARSNDQGLASSITDALDQIRHRVEDAEQNPTSPEAAVPEQRKQGRRTQKVNVDLDMEMLNSFRSKPSKMLSFRCAQDFRRDQFADHYSTVHCDIQAGLDGWFQTRCPLSDYGCEFTRHRFVTDQKDMAVYNPVTESFCVKTTNASESHSSDDEWISQLPDVVMAIIFSYMDSLSVKNLSLTSKIMRDKCSYLLVHHGIVILDWQKQDGAWTIAQKVWSFSSAFDRPRRWRFAEVPSMANHLKTCPYNVKHEYSKEAVAQHHTLFKEAKDYVSRKAQVSRRPEIRWWEPPGDC